MSNLKSGRLPAIARRRLLQAAAAIPFAFVPQRAFGANDRIRVAAIGIGGKGYGDVADVAAAGGEIVALCDVDDNRRVRKKKKDHRELFPKADFFPDFRVMFDKRADSIDAVIVSTPDHVHCAAAYWALQRGKHVYCQKPLTHSISEARLLTETARKMGVATQMGNQAHAGEPIRRAVELVRAGMIGKVREVHAWTNRPIWKQGMARRPQPQTIPAGLDWDLWLGPAPKRPYASGYCPFDWRGWWDFGTGALGDMGCHIMDMPYWALKLGAPQTVSAVSQGNTAESGPTSAVITYRFPATSHTDGELKFVWYDGKSKLPPHVTDGSGLNDKQLAQKYDLVMVGDKGKFFFHRARTDWLVTPHDRLLAYKDTPKTLPRVPNEDAEWLAACRGGSPALSNFANSGPFTEVVLLGNLAIRLGGEIEWDASAMRVRGREDAEQLIRRPYRRGWELS